MPLTLVMLSNLVEVLESLSNKAPCPTLNLPAAQCWLIATDHYCLETRMTHELSLNSHLSIFTHYRFHSAVTLAKTFSSWEIRMLSNRRLCLVFVNAYASRTPRRAEQFQLTSKAARFSAWMLNQWLSAHKKKSCKTPIYTRLIYVAQIAIRCIR